MALSNPYQQYARSSAMTASPGELTLMLYDGCIKHLRLAKEAVAEHNVEGANAGLLKAQAILEHLTVTLDMRYEISGQLFSLYQYMDTKLREANVKKQPEGIGEVIGLLSELRDTWQQAVRLNRQSYYSLPEASNQV